MVTCTPKRGGSHEAQAIAGRGDRARRSADGHGAVVCGQDGHHHRRLQAGRRLRRHRAHAGAPPAEAHSRPADGDRAEHAGREQRHRPNHVYNVAKPDGLTIGTFNRNLPIAQLTGVDGVKYDITKFAWIGSAANESTILAIRADLPYKNFEELRKAKETVVIG